MKTKLLITAFLMVTFFNANAQTTWSYSLDETDFTNGVSGSSGSPTLGLLTRGTPTGSLTSISGKFGTGVSFPTPNSNTNGVGLGGAIADNVFTTYPISFSIWVKIITKNTNNPDKLIMLGNSASDNIGLGIYLTQSSQVGLYLKSGTTSAGKYTNANNLVNDGQWHHIVITLSSANDVDKKIYVDKVLFTNVTTTANTITTLPTFNTLAIGSWHRKTSATLTDVCSGIQLDQALVTNQELTQDQINALYDNTSTQIHGLKLEKTSPFKIINGSLVIPSEIDRTSVSLYNALGSMVDVKANLAKNNFYIIRYKNNGQDRVSKIMNW